jgi:hypothetical protein
MTSIQLLQGDCRQSLRGLADNSVDSIVTDPPYELGFMGKGWDSTGIANDPALWADCLRVLKPGGHLAAFSASRTYHRMACAIEDAGFEMRDSLMWLYGTGFPKSMNVSKAVDATMLYGKADSVALRMRDGREPGTVGTNMNKHRSAKNDVEEDTEAAALQTDAAREWEGWGTALKPAFEPIVLARKPLSEKTVAANVLRWRTGALNIDACRVGTSAEDAEAMKRCNTPGSGRMKNGGGLQGSSTFSRSSATGEMDTSKGRWPANVVHDGSDEVIEAFPANAGAAAPVKGSEPSAASNGAVTGKRARVAGAFHGDSGSAARFFYSAKASKADRNGSKHPTVKPVNLMEWLCTLLTPPGGTVLDPFAGSGTTGAAARNKGFSVIMCELEVDYIADIRRRLSLDVLPRCPVPLPA